MSLVLRRVSLMVAGDCTGGSACCWSACWPVQDRIIVTETVTHRDSNNIYNYVQLNITLSKIYFNSKWNINNTEDSNFVTIIRLV